MIALILGIVVGLGGAVIVAIATLLGSWGERKVAAKLQRRIGVNTLGPAGIFQGFADLAKSLSKEDLTPGGAQVGVFRTAPFLVYVPLAMGFAVLPFAAKWAAVDTPVGMLFFLAVPSISVMGILLGGWSSGSTFATIGAIRSGASMISYEVPRTLSVLAVVLLAGSVRPLTVVEQWRAWWIPLTAIGLVVFYISSLAELNRLPFDLAEAESELVAGYFTEYSGLKFAVFMMAEYGGMFVTALFASMFFLGTGRWLPGLAGTAVTVVVSVLIFCTMVWVRWTLPRMRADQLMSFAWKVLTPMALVQLVLVGVVVPWLK